MFFAAVLRFITVRARFILSRRVITVVRLFRRDIHRISCNKFAEAYLSDDALYQSLGRFIFGISIILVLDLTEAPSNLVLIRNFEFIVI